MRKLIVFVLTIFILTFGDDYSYIHKEFPQAKILVIPDQSKYSRPQYIVINGHEVYWAMVKGFKEQYKSGNEDFFWNDAIVEKKLIVILDSDTCKE